MHMHKYAIYNKYANTYSIKTSKAIQKCDISLFFAESLLNFHEDVRRKTWTPIAWLPIYDAAKSKRPTQGYESDAARVMRLYHDCWRRILGRWKEKTENTRLVTFGDRRRHQTRSFVGGLLGDQQVRLLHTKAYSAYYILYCI